MMDAQDFADETRRCFLCDDDATSGTDDDRTLWWYCSSERCPGDSSLAAEPDPESLIDSDDPTPVSPVYEAFCAVNEDKELINNLGSIDEDQTIVLVDLEPVAVFPTPSGRSLMLAATPMILSAYRISVANERLQEASEKLGAEIREIIEKAWVKELCTYPFQEEFLDSITTEDMKRILVTADRDEDPDEVFLKHSPTCPDGEDCHLHPVYQAGCPAEANARCSTNWRDGGVEINVYRDEHVRRDTGPVDLYIGGMLQLYSMRAGTAFRINMDIVRKAICYNEAKGVVFKPQDDPRPHSIHCPDMPTQGQSMSWRGSINCTCDERGVGK